MCLNFHCKNAFNFNKFSFRYKEKENSLEDSMKEYIKIKTFDEFKLAINRELTNMKIGVNSKLKQISQGKKKIKYLDIENSELVDNRDKTNEAYQNTKQIPSIHEQTNNDGISSKLLLGTNNYEKQTYLFLEKLNSEKCKNYVIYYFQPKKINYKTLEIKQFLLIIIITIIKIYQSKLKVV